MALRAIGALPYRTTGLSKPASEIARSTTSQFRRRSSSLPFVSRDLAAGRPGRVLKREGHATNFIIMQIEDSGGRSATLLRAYWCRAMSVRIRG